MGLITHRGCLDVTRSLDEQMQEAYRLALANPCLLCWGKAEVPVFYGPASTGEIEQILLAEVGRVEDDERRALIVALCQPCASRLDVLAAIEAEMVKMIRPELRQLG